MIALGLHWDSFQGIFLQAPLLLFGLLGIAPFVRANPRGALCVLLVYLAVIVPNSMHHNWYGGASLAGRYAWAAVGLWVFPLAYAFKTILARPWGKYVFGAICAASVTLQAMFAPIWLTGGFLMNQGVGMPQWMQRNLYSTLLPLSPRQNGYLPYFGDFATYLNHLPNLLLVMAGAPVGDVGLCTVGEKTNGAVGYAGCTARRRGGIRVYQNAPAGKNCVACSTVISSVGRLEEGQRAATTGEAGILAASPQLKFYPDVQYRLTLTYRYRR